MALRRTLTKITPHYFPEIRAILKIFADFNHQFICIHHTKRQTEGMLSSCSILNLKTLFKFVSQGSLVPYLESGLCSVRNELDNCDFAVVWPSNIFFRDVIVKRINMRLSDLLAGCQYILNSPRRLP